MIDLKRNCPNCNVEIKYSTKSSFYTARKQNRLCILCALKNRKKRIFSDKEKEQAKQQLKKVTNKRPLYSIWLEKYGKEEADLKLIKLKEKQSILNSGEKNNMFGKPSPQGSGNGWSGWYKNWYFRSLRELSYMINVIEKQNLNWRNADKNYKISYTDYTGKVKLYYPDFIIDNKIIEIKPIKLHSSPKVFAKKIAAENFAKTLNMFYELIDPPILSEEEIKMLYLNNKIRFIDKYDKKFKERYCV